MIWAGVAAVVGLFLLLFLGALWSMLRHARLAPPSVRGLAPGESFHVLDLAVAPTRRRFEELGFRVAGYVAVQPIHVELTDEVVQLLMRNDETRTVACLLIRDPFSDARPARVSFDSFLSDGSMFSTVDGSSVSLFDWRDPEHRQQSAAFDEEGLYKDHLAAIRLRGMAVREVPSFDDIVVANALEAARLWVSQVDSGVVRQSSDGSFRHPAAKSLFGMVPLLLRALASKRLENRRDRLAEQTRPRTTAAPRPPELHAFIEKRTGKVKTAAREASDRFHKGPRRALLWIVAIATFIVTWRALQHRHRVTPRPQGRTSSSVSGDAR